MDFFTDVVSVYPQGSAATTRKKLVAGHIRSVEKSRSTLIDDNPEPLSDSAVTTIVQNTQKLFESPVPSDWTPTSADSVPLQIWEGTVQDVDYSARVMHVILNAKIGQVPRHSADIDLEWVADQDNDLVRPGAVFYLTLFKRTRRGSIQNSQELRFRRRPSWSPMQLQQIDKESSELFGKMKTLPTAE